MDLKCHVPSPHSKNNQIMHFIFQKKNYNVCNFSPSTQCIFPNKLSVKQKPDLNWHVHIDSMASISNLNPSNYTFTDYVYTS